MADYRIISADSHLVEPPDMYTSRIAPKFRDRAPRMERRKTPGGRDYDAWMLAGQQVGTLGAVMQAGQRFEDPSQIDFLGLWEDVRKGAYTAAWTTSCNLAAPPTIDRCHGEIEVPFSRTIRSWTHKRQKKP